VFEKFGFVGNITTMVLVDADDFDFAHAIVDTEVVFNYEAPASGPLEVVVDAILTLGRHKLSIENEWGWSEHWTHQRNYLSLNVFTRTLPSVLWPRCRTSTRREPATTAGMSQGSPPANTTLARW